MLSLVEINEYYKNLGIKAYWSLDSLSLKEINIIKDKFSEMHEKYPYVVIEEIGDYYSIDKLKHENAIKSAREMLITKKFIKNEYYQNNPEAVKIAEENLKMLLDKLENENIDINDKKYIDAEFSADYLANERKIRFNHKFKNNLIGNTYHEFGHAVAYQYDLNNNFDIGIIYSSLDKDSITKRVSEYAAENIKEFIAEIFMNYHLQNYNCLINGVMEIIDKEVKNGKAMAQTDRFINNILGIK